MSQLTMVQMLVENQALPLPMNEQVVEIVTRNAEAKFNPFIKAYFPEGGEKASLLAKQLWGNGAAFQLVEVRGAMNSVHRDLRSISKDCKNMSLQVDQIFKTVSSVQSLAYLNTGLSLVNVGVSVAGFAMISGKLNTLSVEVQRISCQLNQITAIIKNNFISQFQTLTMLYNQMSGKLSRNEKIDLDAMEKLLIDMRAFLSEMVRDLNEQALQEEILLEIIYTLIPAYTALLCEFVKLHYFKHLDNSPNYTMFLALYDELESADFRKHLFDYYMLDRKLPNIDVIDILNAQSLLGINGRVHVEDELGLVRIFETEEKYNQFEKELDNLVIAQIQIAAASSL